MQLNLIDCMFFTWENDELFLISSLNFLIQLCLCQYRSCFLRGGAVLIIIHLVTMKQEQANFLTSYPLATLETNLSPQLGGERWIGKNKWAQLLNFISLKSSPRNPTSNVPKWIWLCLSLCCQPGDGEFCAEAEEAIKKDLLPFMYELLFFYYYCVYFIFQCD